MLTGSSVDASGINSWIDIRSLAFLLTLWGFRGWILRGCQLPGRLQIVGILGGLLRRGCRFLRGHGGPFGILRGRVGSGLLLALRSCGLIWPCGWPLQTRGRGSPFATVGVTGDSYGRGPPWSSWTSMLRRGVSSGGLDRSQLAKCPDEIVCTIGAEVHKFGHVEPYPTLGLNFTVIVRTE